jgi:DNA-binding response OmpR family regulator
MQDIAQDGAQYGAADVLLFDAVPSHRGTTRAALSMMGFKQIIASSDIEEVAQSIAQKPFDVLIADLSGPEERVCKLVRDIRQGEIGSNPFMAVLLTSWGLREDHADMVMSSGADDVLVRPYSVSFLANRVQTLVEARKGFVVTADYVGPCRRKNADPMRSAGLIAVPNTLRMKAKPEETGEAGVDIVSMVREARAKVSELKLAGSALQMRLLAHFALEAVAGGKSIEKYKAPMSMFSRVLHDKLQVSGDLAMATAGAEIMAAVTAVMQGAATSEALARVAGVAKTIHARLCSHRAPDELEQEFSHAIGRLAMREAQVADMKTGT